MGKLITLVWRDDRIAIILLSFIKIGIIKTGKSDLFFSGYSIAFGIWKMELQLNISMHKQNIMNFKRNEIGNA